MRQRKFLILIAIAPLMFLTVQMLISRSKPGNLKNDAELIVEGRVQKIDSCSFVVANENKGDDFVCQRDIVEIEITKVEKGGNLKKGDTVYARTSNHVKYPSKGIASHGCDNSPTEGATVVAYLRKAQDGGWDALMNGLQVIGGKPANPETKKSIEDF